MAVLEVFLESLKTVQTEDEKIYCLLHYKKDVKPILQAANYY